MKSVYFLLLISFLATYSNGQKLSENFSDGNFTSNPTWTGEILQFIVNQNNELQLSGDKDRSPAFLVTPAFWKDTCAWEFKIKADLKLSASVNYAVIYLASSSPNLNGDLDGYYIKLGENGDNDAIQFYKQQGSTKTKLGRGIDATMGDPNGGNEMRIRVTRSKVGEWVFSSDTTGNSTFIEEFRLTDNSMVSGDYFGLLVSFSSANTDKFIFDDILMEPLFQDTIAPKLLNVEVPASDTIVLTFDEILDSALSATAKFEVLGIGKPTKVIVAPFPHDKITLVLPNKLTDNIEYDLEIEGVADSKGNVLKQQYPKSVVNLVTQPASIFDILITEIFADPEPSLGIPEIEFIEIYNRADHPISLNGWLVSDGTTTATLSDFVLNKNTYLILTNTVGESDYKAYGKVLGVSGFPGLNNTGELIALQDDQGTIIHFVEYSDGWYSSEISSSGGFSLEMIDTENPCGRKENWMSAKPGVYATPGTKNSVNAVNPDNVKPILINVIPETENTLSVRFSETLMPNGALDLANYSLIGNANVFDQIDWLGSQNDAISLLLKENLELNIIYELEVAGIKDCVGNEMELSTLQFAIAKQPDSFDLVLNELLFNPVSGGSDFIEIVNRSDKYIDLRDLQIANRDDEGLLNSVYRVSEQGTLLFPGQYFVITADKTFVESEYLVKYPDRILQIASLPSMPDKDGTVVLLAKDSTIIDEFRYNDGMHYELLRDDDGVSLERLNIESKSQDKNNWHSAASSVGYATPGYVNSQSTTTNPTDKVVELSLDAFSPDNDGFEDFIQITINNQNLNSSVKIDIYSLTGVKVKSLVDHHVLGTNSTYTWDGVKDNGDKASIGGYVIITEIINLNGSVEKYKDAVAVVTRF